MLDIPSSVFSFFSFSKGLVGLFGGVCIGARVASTFVLSVPKNSPTRTIEIVLLPTTCVLSTGPVFFPYVAAMGYATVILASAICILRAKAPVSCSQVLPPGTPLSSDPPIHDTFPQDVRPLTPAQHGVDDQPPAPPPELGSSCKADKAPRRSLWAWLFALITIVLALVGGYIYFTGSEVPDSFIRVASSIVQGLLWVEQCFIGGWIAVASWISTIKSYVSLHGWHHSKILLLALSTHSVCLLVVSGLYRLRRRLVYLRDPIPYLISGVIILSLATIASFSQLSWIFWMQYYFGCRAEDLSSVQEISRYALRIASYLSSLSTSHLVEMRMVVGIISIHTSAACLCTPFLILSGFPSANLKTLVRLLVHPPVFRWLLSTWIILTGAFTIMALIDNSLWQYMILRPHVKQLLWRSFSCPNSREEVRRIFWLLLGEYQDWKSVQIEDFNELAAGIPNALLVAFKSCIETWSVLPLIQKFLIAAPIAMFYGYLYIASTTYLGTYPELATQMLAVRWMTANRRPVEVVKAAPKARTIIEDNIQRDRRRTIREAAGEAMGIVGDARPFSPPASSLTSAISGFLS
ncbi:hypothetical protein C8R44DRAFT_947879 [Mycena epipterygia]|nr:hypothetical protein C8R44DRAFT_947879 [Mycena epipterygia]